MGGHSSSGQVKGEVLVQGELLACLLNALRGIQTEKDLQLGIACGYCTLLFFKHWIIAPRNFRLTSLVMLCLGVD